MEVVENTHALLRIKFGDNWISMRGRRPVRVTSKFLLEITIGFRDPGTLTGGTVSPFSLSTNMKILSLKRKYRIFGEDIS